MSLVPFIPVMAKAAELLLNTVSVGKEPKNDEPPRVIKYARPLSDNEPPYATKYPVTAKPWSEDEPLYSSRPPVTAKPWSEDESLYSSRSPVTANPWSEDEPLYSSRPPVTAKPWSEDEPLYSLRSPVTANPWSEDEPLYSSRSPVTAKPWSEAQRTKIAELEYNNKELMEELKRKKKAQAKKEREADARDEESHEQIQKYQELHKTQTEQMTKLMEELKKTKPTSFEDIAENNKQAKEVIIKLAKEAAPLGLEGNNIALFGITSSGKSTMLNELYGKEVAETGAGETTLKIQSYKASDNGSNFVLWDIPGKNDEVSYLSMPYISFFKGLTYRIILVTHTLKENSSMMKLLDAIGLNYDIVVNKMDQCDDKEQAKLREGIKKEIQTLELKGVGRIFYVSAKFPHQFPDWVQMVNYLTGRPK